MIYILAFTIIILGFLLVKFLPHLNKQLFFITGICLVVITSVGILIMAPKMHKPFNLNVIEKIVKINADGSSTIIEKTTTMEKVHE